MKVLTTNAQLETAIGLFIEKIGAPTKNLESWIKPIFS